MNSLDDNRGMVNSKLSDIQGNNELWQLQKRKPNKTSNCNLTKKKAEMFIDKISEYLRV